MLKGRTDAQDARILIVEQSIGVIRADVAGARESVAGLRGLIEAQEE
jgi:hypothetical protein